ncbi:MAG: phosphotransferase [Alphaproteobacteria bacterium]|nr:phosphotransferase [Alphaproteobacteria bacterium]
MNNNQKQILQWAEDYLNINGYKVLNKPQIIRDMPWSCVTKFDTSKGGIFLKSMAKDFSIEPKILLFLSRHITQKVPKIIASNVDLSCFLMKDCGVPLRTILKKSFNAELYCKALEIYADIQIKTIPYVDKLLMTGVNDWRLKKLSQLYNDFIKQRDMLIVDGLMPSEIDVLEHLIPKLQILCERLASYTIPETIEHGDFHDNNILIQGDRITINDWGDTSIAHPFFSIVSVLDSAKRNHQLNDKVCLKLQKMYLAQWKDYGTEDNLQEAFVLAQIIKHFTFALSFARIKSCDGIELFPEYKGYVAESLRDFIKNSMDKF